MQLGCTVSADVSIIYQKNIPFPRHVMLVQLVLQHLNHATSTLTQVVLELSIMLPVWQPIKNNLPSSDSFQLPKIYDMSMPDIGGFSTHKSRGILGIQCLDINKYWEGTSVHRIRMFSSVSGTGWLNERLEWSLEDCTLTKACILHPKRKSNRRVWERVHKIEDASKELHATPYRKLQQY